MNDIGKSQVVLAGIGGVGMSALAQLLVALGYRVTGTDRLCDRGVETAVLRKLKRMGVEIAPQDGSALKESTAALVTSTAVENDNPDVIAAASRGVPVRHRAEVLAECVAGMRCIAVGGTSGKSTITGMLGWIFEQCGCDPTVVNGAPVLNWMDQATIGNVRMGDSNIAIVEADESDRSLLRFEPEFATISNISRDHFSLDDSIELFAQFAGKTTGEVIIGPGVPRERIGDNTYTPQETISDKDQTFLYRGIQFVCPQPGRHNLENALIAVALCDRFGLGLQSVRDALSSFAGIERRFERVGVFHGATVIDDYAHNPAKIEAAWRTAQTVGQRVIGVWRPHGFGPLYSMRKELAQSFQRICRDLDRLYILPVYYAGGTTDRKICSEEFVESLQSEGLPAEYVADYPQLQTKLESIAEEGDVILLMGARDPQIPEFARKLIH